MCSTFPLSHLQAGSGSGWPGIEASPATEWRAEWIGTGSDADSAPDQWFAFRTAFDIADVPKTAPVRIACDSKYWLWVNGVLTVFEGQLKRGPTPHGTYFDRVDLAPGLRPGKNSVAILVWFFGRHGFSHNNSGCAGLLVDGSGAGLDLLSDDTWRVRRHPAFGTTGEPHPNYRLPEANIHFDARLDLVGWTSPDYDDSAWPRAMPLGPPSAAPWGELYERPIPLWSDSGLVEYPNAAEFPAVSDGGAVVARLPYNAHVTPWLDIESPAGLLIDIRTDNYAGGSANNLRAEYVTREGRQSFESPGWINGHEMRYTIPPGVKIHGLKYRETGFDAEWVGRFACSDPALNILWQKAARTLHVTMRDTYMDCPDRERAQWWGDAVNELGEAFYVFDYVRGPLLARKGILELVRWHKPDGVLYSPVPSGRKLDASREDQVDLGVWNRELPPQMLASVGWYGFWTYYRYTGDRTVIEEAYPAVRRYLSLWEMDPEGLVAHRPGGWDWTDWGEHIDVDVCRNAWYHLALRGAIEMARLTGNDGDITGYEARMRSIEGGFNKAYWRGNQYRSPDYLGATDDRAHALAVVSGLAQPSQYPAIREVLARQYYASPYMEKYVLEALFRMDSAGDGMARMKKRWAVQIDSPLTTLWEGWGLGRTGYGGGTYNHAWSGGALTVLTEFAAGVTPVEPDWRVFRVRPQMGGLDWIESVVPTPHGPISLRLEQKDGGFTAAIDVPEGTQASFELPASSPRVWNTIQLDGAEIVPAAQPVRLEGGAHRIDAR